MALSRMRLPLGGDAIAAIEHKLSAVAADVKRVEAIARDAAFEA
jgi:hypothetical protein